MERSEPSLVPEWLRCSGNSSGSGGSAHHYVSAAHSPRNGCSNIFSEKDSRRASFLDRTFSANSRHCSSNNSSSRHPYSSFNRNQRDKNREREKKSLTGDFWEPNDFDPLGDILSSRTEKDTLRRSHSLLCRKPSEVLPRKAVDVKHVSDNHHSSGNGVLSGAICGSSIQKAAFDKDFPSLGTEEKHVGPDIRRVSSPSMNTAMQSLPTGNISLLGGEGWTSALAEVPSIIGSNTRPVFVQQNAPANAVPAASSPVAGPNMAEALSQAPLRARTTSQLPDKTQMREELAIKQSKQLIPVTPSMPKGSVLNSDKSKLKTSLRVSDTVVVAKGVQQQPQSSQITNQCVHGRQGSSDATTGTKPSNGAKFLVLKQLRDNGTPAAKDVAVATTTNNVMKVATNPLAVASAAVSHVKSPTNLKASNFEGKVAALALNPGPFGGKRPSLSQVQSRNDFFKLMRKKYSTKNSGSSPTAERSAVVVKEAAASASPSITENRSEVTRNGVSHDEEKNLSLNGKVYPDEEEAAFLRSLGWDENAGEDDGLTEEEINAFYEEYMKMKPSLKLCRDVEQKITSLCESHTTGSSRASSELSFSETEVEAEIEA